MGKSILGLLSLAALLSLRVSPTGQTQLKASGRVTRCCSHRATSEHIQREEGLRRANGEWPAQHFGGV